MSALKRIGALSEESGLSISALRFYESEGLLIATSRSNTNYRLYDEAAVDRARFIRHAKQLGFALEDIRDLLIVQDSDSRQEIRRLAAKHVKKVEAQIEKLQCIRAVLSKAVDECDGKGSVKGCPVIHSIVDLDASTDARADN